MVGQNYYRIQWLYGNVCEKKASMNVIKASNIYTPYEQTKIKIGTPYQ
jgi:hypothetical protein